MARLTSDLFVSALLKNAQAKGIFGGVISKGFSAAGAVHIVCYNGAEGTYTLFPPAPQMAPEADNQPIGGRQFEERHIFTAYADLQDFIASEKRFDADLWVVELEATVEACEGLFSIVNTSD